ncbi:MAG: TIGR02996 domain-containing protein [Gemmataceae bacterium]|nr:TIGR02996 domain-containing protein [Gemmataceae bacterium]
MGDREALLSAICAHPDEDTPRLIFADFLEENDRPAQAEFIRTQVELARTPAWEPFAVRCRWRRPDVVSGKGFLSTLPKLPGGQVDWAAEHPFRRGFGWWILVRAVSLWPDMVEPLFAQSPVGKVNFWNATLDDWRRVGASECLRHLREVAFIGSPIEPLFALRDLERACGIADLHFARASGAGMPEVIEDLFQSRLGGAVRGLHFHIGYESRDALIDALNTGPPLDRLSFSVMGLSSETLRKLFDGTVASATSALHFVNEPFGADGLRVLADALPHTLQDLTLVNIGTPADGVEAFARGDRLANLRRLNLSGNALTPRAVKVLSLSRALASLRSLDLSSCHIGDKGVRHVTQAKWWHTLTEVNLRNNAISAVGIKHLLNAPLPPDLTALVLDQDTLGGESRSALARKFGEAVVFVPADPPATFR